MAAGARHTSPIAILIIGAGLLAIAFLIGETLRGFDDAPDPPKEAADSKLRAEFEQLLSNDPKLRREVFAILENYRQAVVVDGNSLADIDGASK